MSKYKMIKYKLTVAPADKERDRRFPKFRILCSCLRECLIYFNTAFHPEEDLSSLLVKVINMSSEHDHVVQVPRFFILLRIAQIILTFIVFVLACYGISFNNWYFDGLGYALFVVRDFFFF